MELLDAVWRCEPELWTQVACLVVAMGIIEVVMRLGAWLTQRTLYRMPRIYAHTIDECKNHLRGGMAREFVEAAMEDFVAGGTTPGFKTWSNRTAAQIAKVPNSTDRGQADSLLQSKYTVDAYVAEPARAALFERFALHFASMDFMMHLQHCSAGVLGLCALLASDAQTFTWYCRWGLLLEAGWELGDYLKDILPKICAGRGKEAIPGVLHHFALYGVLPVNVYVVHGACGREVAWLLVIMAGLVGPVAVLTLIKSALNWKRPLEKLLAQTITVVVAVIFLVSRGPVWVWLAARFWSKTQDGSPALRIFIAVLIGFFSLFNVLIYFMMFESIAKIFKVRKEKKDTSLEKQIHLDMLRGLADPAAFAKVRMRTGRTLWAKVRVARTLAKSTRHD